MRRLFALLVAASLCLPTASSAWWQSIQQVAVSGAAPVGPPTFTFESVAGFSTGSATTVATGPTSIGTDTFLVALFYVQDPSPPTTPTGASFTVNGSSVGATITRLGSGSETSNSLEYYVAYAPVSSSLTSSSLTVNWSGGIFNTSAVAFYSAKTAQMVSTTPTLVPVVSVTSGTSASSGAFNVAAGGAVLTMAATFGAGSSQSFTTPNTPPITQDASFSSQIFGSKSNASANASSQVSMTWSGSITGGEADIAAVVFR
jgi:hypothetical protein